MIDTLRLRGPAVSYRLNWTFEKYYCFRTPNGDFEKIPITLIENKKDAKKRSLYRVFYVPSANLMDVEINVGKLLFEYNVYNYSVSSVDLDLLIRRVGACFFSANDYYVSRVDLGHVQTYESRAETQKVIDQYRHSRLPGAYSRKFKHQNYKDSVFYKTENWSVKVYDKYAEMVHSLGIEIAKEIVPQENVVRYEKTYRIGEMKRLGMIPDPYKGVHIDSFQVAVLMNDYLSVFGNWEFSATPHITEGKGVIGLISYLDNLGQLSELEAAGIVSRSSIWRYKKEKASFAVDAPRLKITQNISKEQQQKFTYCVNQGIIHLLG